MKTISLLFVLLCSSSLFGMDKQEEAVRKQEMKQEEDALDQANQPRGVARYDSANEILVALDKAKKENFEKSLILANIHRTRPPHKKEETKTH